MFLWRGALNKNVFLFKMQFIWFLNIWKFYIHPFSIPMSGVEALGEGNEEIAEEQWMIPSYLPEIDDLENQDNLR